MPTVAGSIGAKGDIGESIGTKRMLLVLDNFEQLLAARSDVTEILADCANVQLLVTSREPLNVAAEREYRVPPMTEADAVALFDERAVEGGSRETTADVCRRVDCLPLAVELAAARTRAFTLEQVLSRLDDRLSFLSGVPATRPLGSKRCGRRSTGATTCCGPGSSGCLSGWASLLAAGTLRGLPLCASSTTVAARWSRASCP